MDANASLPVISVARIEVPFREPFTTSVGTWLTRASWLVRLRDDAGRTGIGEIALDPAASPRELEATEYSIRGTVEAVAAGVDLGRLLPELPAAVRSGLDAASVGLARATAGTASPGTGVRVPVNATIGSGTLEATVAAARAAVAAGFGTLKLKGGSEPSPADLAQRLRAVRDAVGPAIRLRLDVNGAWSLKMAVEWLTALGPIGLEYVEQPIVPSADPRAIADLATLRSASPVPIGVDESVMDLASARAILDARAADVLVVKPARVGGVSAALEIADLARRADVQVVVSTMLETGVGLAAGLAAAASIADAAVSGPAHGLGTAGLLATDLLAEPLVVTAGTVVARDLENLRVNDEEIRRLARATYGVAW